MGFFNEYRYSMKATFFSAFFCMASILFAIPIIYTVMYVKNIILMILIFVLCAAGAVFSYVYLGKTVADKIAEKDFNKKITTNIKFAYEYCTKNPESFESVCKNNPEFAERYRMDSEGKIYKVD